MKKHILVILAAVVVVLAFASCGRRQETVLAEINGEKITSSEFIKLIGGTDFAAMALKQVLDDRLMLALAKERGVAPTEEQVSRRLSIMRKVQDLDAQLRDTGQTIDDAREQLRVQQASINLAEQAMREKVTDEDVKNTYEMQKPLIYDVAERVRTDYVLFRTEDAARKAAKEIEGGATLEKVAESAGNDHSQLMHEVIPKERPGLPVELTKAAFETPKGKTSKPIKLALGFTEQWIILRPGDRLPPVKISFDEAKPIIRGELALQRASQDSGYQKKLEEARRKAKITVFEPSLKRVEKDFRKPLPRPAGGTMPPAPK